MMAGLGIAAAYSFSYFCFTSERQRGTLKLLLSLPLRPSDLVLAKYASLYSMALFTAVFPALFLGDFYLLLIMSAFVLFLSTLCMSFTVISDKPWAPVIPMWIVIFFFMPIQKIFERYFPDGLTVLRFFAEHVTVWALLALALTPFIAIGAAAWFEHSQFRS
jgi:ABC-type Na+ efflux pump permease subunit